ncbi:hypothetical protein QBC47DRAFT_373581 [Echria macrotheca]|uniref:C2H2-type domain-containing protein n=1 Tax=Echria macrotheca TaxID=438768 RepID=A0AAJ0FEC6_9PEZI|nr:hypothetical protein QBC47DRAFT_373581 [Echria macrotheca]
MASTTETPYKSWGFETPQTFIMVEPLVAWRDFLTKLPLIVIPIGPCDEYLREFKCPWIRDENVTLIVTSSELIDKLEQSLFTLAQKLTWSVKDLGILRLILTAASLAHVVPPLQACSLLLEAWVEVVLVIIFARFKKAPSKTRRPYATLATMPWSVGIALIVLWGSFWRFRPHSISGPYDDIYLDNYFDAEPDFSSPTEFHLPNFYPDFNEPHYDFGDDFLKPFDPNAVDFGFDPLVDNPTEPRVMAAVAQPLTGAPVLITDSFEDEASPVHDLPASFEINTGPSPPLASELAADTVTVSRPEAQPSHDPSTKHIVCDECPTRKTFSRIPDLERHKREKHSDPGQREVFYCPVPQCKRHRVGFSRKDNRDRHVASRHVGTLLPSAGSGDAASTSHSPSSFPGVNPQQPGTSETTKRVREDSPVTNGEILGAHPPKKTRKPRAAAVTEADTIVSIREVSASTASHTEPDQQESPYDREDHEVQELRKENAKLKAELLAAKDDHAKELQSVRDELRDLRSRLDERGRMLDRLLSWGRDARGRTRSRSPRS